MCVNRNGNWHVPHCHCSIAEYRFKCIWWVEFSIDYIFVNVACCLVFVAKGWVIVKTEQ